MNHVEVQNLRKADLTQKRVGKIEEAIKAAVRKIIGEQFEKQFSVEGISFNFSYDPTVTSEKIPVVIKAELIFDEPDNGFSKKELERKIWMEFKSAVREWRRLSTLKVRVTFLPLGDGGYIR